VRTAFMGLTSSGGVTAPERYQPGRGPAKQFFLSTNAVTAHAATSRPQGGRGARAEPSSPDGIRCVPLLSRGDAASDPFKTAAP